MFKFNQCHHHMRPRGHTKFLVVFLLKGVFAWRSEHPVEPRAAPRPTQHKVVVCDILHTPTSEIKGMEEVKAN